MESEKSTSEVRLHMRLDEIEYNVVSRFLDNLE